MMEKERLPERIAGFRVLDVLGEGAMGTVYLAERRGDVRQRVALKVIKLGMDSKEILARFDLERQALAVMNHDAIAKVFDAGVTESGQSFFAMEYVEGIQLDLYCDDHNLEVPERIRIFQKICAGVQHAHHKGIVHRDLKPTNILVGRKGDDHFPKIIDFGLARATNRQLVKHTILTEEGRVLGTPEYMSPEQALGTDAEIDARTDIYALGVILYQMLSGYLPFPTDRLRQLPMSEIQRVIREEPPVRPSTKIGAVGEAAEDLAAKRCTDGRTLYRSLRGDLDWVVMKAMAKEPERRYGSAGALADDLQCFLQGMPVHARPPSTAYRLSRFVRRHRVQVTAAALVFLTAATGFIVSTVLAIRANELADDYAELLVDARLDALLHREAQAHPAWPESTGELRSLIRMAGQLLEKRPEIEEAMAELRAGHVLEEPVRRSKDRGPYAEDALQTRFEAERRFLGSQLDDPNTTTEAKAAGAREIATLTERIEEISDRRDFSNRIAIPDLQEMFLYDLLDAVLARMRALQHETLPDLTFRKAWSERVRTETCEELRDEWQAAAGRVAEDPRFGPDFRLVPQLGLVPIGQDPRSGLEEFGHPLSGEVPTRDPDTGELRLGLGHSIVFVLLPKGRYRFGYHDRLDPQHLDKYPEVEVGPLFLAKHETSRAQWESMARGVRGLRLIDGGYLDLRNRFDQPEKPANAITAVMCEKLLSRYGLRLPREAEWEYACKAGTETLWFTGNEIDSLLGHANLKDPRLEDGYPIGLAPIHSMLPNPFGLHNTTGNVLEWCGDNFRDSRDVRSIRGGSFVRPLDRSFSVYRDWTIPTDTAREVGVRPARDVFQRSATSG